MSLNHKDFKYSEFFKEKEIEVDYEPKNKYTEYPFVRQNRRVKVLSDILGVSEDRINSKPSVIVNPLHQLRKSVDTNYPKTTKTNLKFNNLDKIRISRQQEYFEIIGCLLGMSMYSTVYGGRVKLNPEREEQVSYLEDKIKISKTKNEFKPNDDARIYYYSRGDFCLTIRNPNLIYFHKPENNLPLQDMGKKACDALYRGFITNFIPGKNRNITASSKRGEIIRQIARLSAVRGIKYIYQINMEPNREFNHWIWFYRPEVLGEWLLKDKRFDFVREKLRTMPTFPENEVLRHTENCEKKTSYKVGKRLNEFEISNIKEMDRELNLINEELRELNEQYWLLVQEKDRINTLDYTGNRKIEYKKIKIKEQKLEKKIRQIEKEKQDAKQEKAEIKERRSNFREQKKFYNGYGKSQIEQQKHERIYDERKNEP